MSGLEWLAVVALAYVVGFIAGAGGLPRRHPAGACPHRDYFTDRRCGVWNHTNGPGGCHLWRCQRHRTDHMPTHPDHD